MDKGADFIKKGSRVLVLASAGFGMNVLAQYFVSRGCKVFGMDRSFDLGGRERVRVCLESLGVSILSEKDPVPDPVDTIFLSPAIEKEHPALLEAQRRKILLLKRSEFLVRLFNEHHGIGISGTSGKTTVTGMLSWMACGMKKKPFVFCGDEILNFASKTRLGNFLAGNQETMILEIDESDGLLPEYRPHLAGITSIQKDHFPLKDLRRMFGAFAENSKTVVYNRDCAETRKLFGKKDSKGISVSLLNRKADYFGKLETRKGSRILYSVNGVPGELTIAGEYNVQNALLAVALACELGQSVESALERLRTFKGIRNRFELRQKKGSYFILDFAHNPEKVTASLRSAQNLGSPVVYVFQPHGYGPLKFMLNEFAEAFRKNLRKQDTLIILPVYDAGGTADRSVRSVDLVKKIKRSNVLSMDSREALKSWARKSAPSPVSWVIAGARDETLHNLRDELKCRTVCFP